MEVRCFGIILGILALPGCFVNGDARRSTFWRPPPPPGPPGNGKWVWIPHHHPTGSSRPGDWSEDGWTDDGWDDDNWDDDDWDDDGWDDDVHDAETTTVATKPRWVEYNWVDDGHVQTTEAPPALSDDGHVQTTEAPPTWSDNGHVGTAVPLSAWSDEGHEMTEAPSSWSDDGHEMTETPPSSSDNGHETNTQHPPWSEDGHTDNVGVWDDDGHTQHAPLVDMPVEEWEDGAQKDDGGAEEEVEGGSPPEIAGSIQQNEQAGDNPDALPVGIGDNPDALPVGIGAAAAATMLAAGAVLFAKKRQNAIAAKEIEAEAEELPMDDHFAGEYGADMEDMDIPPPPPMEANEDAIEIDDSFLRMPASQASVRTRDHHQASGKLFEIHSVKNDTSKDALAKWGDFESI